MGAWVVSISRFSSKIKKKYVGNKKSFDSLFEYD